MIKEYLVYNFLYVAFVQCKPDIYVYSDDINRKR